MLVNVYHVERKTDAPILLADVSKRPRLSWIPELQAKRYQVPRIYRMDLRNAIAFVHCKNAQYAEATEIIEDILKRKNLNFLTALSNMSNGAISHYKLGNHERAEELVKLWLNAPGLAKHIYVHGVANVAIELKLYTLAQELYERSLATYEEFNQSPPKKIISKLTKVYELNGDEKAIAELNSKYPKKITNP